MGSEKWAAKICYLDFSASFAFRRSPKVPRGKTSLQLSRISINDGQLFNLFDVCAIKKTHTL
jgi:hypothetical protein